MDFLDQLKSFDKDDIDKTTIKKMQKFMDDPEFTPEAISKVTPHVIRVVDIT
jgi:hypothetical protein